MAEALRAEVCDSDLAFPTNEASLYHDLLAHALASVEWREIAAHYIDDVADEIDAEEAENAASNSHDWMQGQDPKPGR